MVSWSCNISCCKAHVCFNRWMRPCRIHENLPFTQPNICHGESATTSGDASLADESLESKDPTHPGNSATRERKEKVMWDNLFNFDGERIRFMYVNSLVIIWGIAMNKNNHHTTQWMDHSCGRAKEWTLMNWWFRICNNLLLNLLERED